MIELLQEQNLQLSQTLALNEAQTSVLQGMMPEIPQYQEGGPVLSTGVAQLHAGEHVVPVGGTLVSNSAPPNITIEHHWHGKSGELANFIDSRIAAPKNVQVVSRTIGQRTSLLRGAPGGR